MGNVLFSMETGEDYEAECGGAGRILSVIMS